VSDRLAQPLHGLTQVNGSPLIYSATTWIKHQLIGCIAIRNWV